MKTFVIYVTVAVFVAGFLAGFLAHPDIEKGIDDLELKTGGAAKEAGGEPSRILARVGSYDLTEMELKTRWRELLTLERKQQVLGRGGIRAYLNEIIEEKLLQQEALERGLDRDYAIRLRMEVETAHLLTQPLLKEEVWEQPRPEEEMKEYYEEHLDTFRHKERVTVRHILVTPRPYRPGEVRSRLGDDAETDEEAREKIGEILGKLMEGEDFEALARDYSEDSSCTGGGLLEPFGRGVMEESFEEEAFRLNPGDTSGIIKTRFGYHLIKVEEKSPEKLMTYQESRPLIIKRLVAADPDLMKKRYHAYLEELSRKYPVVVDESYFRKEIRDYTVRE